MNCAFTNARLIDPANGLDETGNLIVENGKIFAIGKKAKAPSGVKTHDCKAWRFCPALSICKSSPASRAKSIAKHWPPPRKPLLPVA